MSLFYSRILVLPSVDIGIILFQSSPMKDDDADILYSQTCAILSMLDHHDIEVN